MSAKYITFAEFRKFLANRDIFNYNRRLVETSLGDAAIFDNAIVLDAGAGKRLKHFKNRMARAAYVVGIDVALEDLRENKDIASRVVGDVQDLPFKSGTFDCALSVDVVEHLTDPRAFLSEIARCLKPGGTLVICTPNLLGYKNIIASLLPRAALDLAWRVFKGRPEGQPHRTYYRANTPRSMRRAAEAAGLRLEQACYLDELSHFYYSRPLVCLLAYGYGRLLRALHMSFFLNYLVFVLRRVEPVAEDERTTRTVRARGVSGVSEQAVEIRSTSPAGA